jgi:hypothetical protein
MSCNHISQGKHNESLLNDLKTSFPTKYNDWKITIVFYTALHYLKAFAKIKGKEIGTTHDEMIKNIDASRHDCVLQVTKPVFETYKRLYRYSRDSRYDGINYSEEIYEADRLKDLAICEGEIVKFKNYLRTNGLQI